MHVDKCIYCAQACQRWSSLWFTIDCSRRVRIKRVTYATHDPRTWTHVHVHVHRPRPPAPPSSFFHAVASPFHSVVTASRGMRAHVVHRISVHGNGDDVVSVCCAVRWRCQDRPDLSVSLCYPDRLPAGSRAITLGTTHSVACASYA